MESNYSLLVADQEDTEQILGMLLLAQEETPYKDFAVDVDRLRENVSDWLSHDDISYILKAQEENGNIIGFLLFQVTDDNKFLPGIKIQQELFFYVLPEYRSTTVGRDLKRTFELNAEEVGCEACSMGLMYNEYSEGLDKLYTRSGYEPAEKTYIKRIN